MNCKIIPRCLSGNVAAVASKSDVHRAMIGAALVSDGAATELMVSTSNQDIEATARCLVAMGATVSPKEQRWCITPVQVRARSLLDCGESGSTLRFLLPVVSALGLCCTVTGAGRLPERPLSPLLEEMIGHGALIEGVRLPLTLSGQLLPGEYRLPGNVSSQYISGLLFALPLLPGESRIVLTSPLESTGYVEMTIGTLEKFGVVIDREPTGWHIVGNQRYRSPGHLVAEGDWSNAAFYLAAGALGKAGSAVTVSGLAHDSAQGDRAILSLLRQFGAVVEERGGQVTVSPGKLRGIEIDAQEIPDLVPILTVIASLSAGTTHIKNAARLRLKESDRLSAVAQSIRALGGSIVEQADGLVIKGGQGTGQGLTGGVVDCQNDHRIAMAMAIAAIGCLEPVVLLGAEAVEKSYPHFYEDYQQLGGIIDGI